MNGGDSRFDKSFPSYSHLLPLYRKVGPYLQFYSSNANEIPYTANWTGPFSGYEQVIDTYRNTESPVRIKPINTYYHFYSGEKKSAVAALTKIYDWVVAQDVFPIFSSKYPTILKGFFDTKLIKEDQNTYRFSNSGSLKTFRIESDQINVDFEASENVIGQKLHQGMLYIHLGVKTEGKIVLTSKQPTLPYLVSSDYEFSRFIVSSKAINLKGHSDFRQTIELNIGKRRFKANEKVAITYIEDRAILNFKGNSVDMSLEFVDVAD